MSLKFSGTPTSFGCVGMGNHKNYPNIWKIEEARPGFRRVPTKWRKIGQIMWKNRKNNNVADVFDINSQKFASRLILGRGIRLWSQKFNILKIWTSCCDVILPYLGKKGTKIVSGEKKSTEESKIYIRTNFGRDNSVMQVKIPNFPNLIPLLWRHIPNLGQN